MLVFDHLGITVVDLPRAIAQFDPVLQALGFGREDAEDSVAWWQEGEPELILFPARDAGAGPHRHGRASTTSVGAMF